VIYFSDGSSLRVAEEWEVEQQTSRQPSDETCLEDVMQVIIPQLPPPNVK
jgi:hypothetical protein